MRVVHEPSGFVLATEVEVADSVGAQMRGLRFRRQFPDDFAFVMEVGHSSLPFIGGPRWNVVDMLFVPEPLDVVWLRGGEVVSSKRMSPWWGIGAARADTIVEFPAGGAEDVAVGDRLRFDAD